MGSNVEKVSMGIGRLFSGAKSNISGAFNAAKENLGIGGISKEVIQTHRELLEARRNTNS